MNICIFGAASARIDNRYILSVETLGKDLAQRGHSLVFGAGGSGLMGAAARGFRSGGGEIYGIIPDFFREEGVEVIYDGCTKLIFTETMRERKARMEDMADAFVVVPGGIGTFEEFFEVLTLKQLGQHNKPIAVYNYDGYYDELAGSLETAMRKNFIPEGFARLYLFSDKQKEIIDYLEKDREETFLVKEMKL